MWNRCAHYFLQFPVAPTEIKPTSEYVNWYISVTNPEMIVSIVERIAKTTMERSILSDSVMWRFGLEIVIVMSLKPEKWYWLDVDDHIKKGD